MDHGSSENGATRDDLCNGLGYLEYPESGLENSCWEDPEELDEDARAAQLAQIAAAERYAACYGRPPLRTHTDVLELLLAAEVIYEVPDACGTQRFYPRIPASTPADSYRVIDLFDPEGKHHEEVVTSLDLASLPSHKVFRIRCDWERFDRTRIGIHGLTEDGKLRVTLPDEL